MDKNYLKSPYATNKTSKILIKINNDLEGKIINETQAAQLIINWVNSYKRTSPGAQQFHTELLSNILSSFKDQTIKNSIAPHYNAQFINNPHIAYYSTKIF